MEDAAQKYRRNTDRYIVQVVNEARVRYADNRDSESPSSTPAFARINAPVHTPITIFALWASS